MPVLLALALLVTAVHGQDVLQEGWTTPRVRASAMLAVPLDFARSENHAAQLGTRIRRARPAPGRSFGETWWAAPPVEETGLVALRGRLAGESWFALRLLAENEAPLEIEINGDLALHELWRDKEQVIDGRRPRALAPVGTVTRVLASRGRNLFLVRVVAAGTGSRFGVAYRGAGVSEVVGRPPPVLAIEWNSWVTEGQSFVDLRPRYSLNWSDEDLPVFTFTLEDGSPMPGAESVFLQMGSRRLRIGGFPLSRQRIYMNITSLRACNGLPFPPWDRPLRVR